MGKAGSWLGECTCCMDHTRPSCASRWLRNTLSGTAADHMEQLRTKMICCDFVVTEVTEQWPLEGGESYLIRGWLSGLLPERVSVNQSAVFVCFIFSQKFLQRTPICPPQISLSPFIPLSLPLPPLSLSQPPLHIPKVNTQKTQGWTFSRPVSTMHFHKTGIHQHTLN